MRQSATLTVVVTAHMIACVTPAGDISRPSPAPPPRTIDFSERRRQPGVASGPAHSLDVRKTTTQNDYSNRLRMEQILHCAWFAGTSLALLAHTVRAQTCTGGTSFKQQTARIGTEYSRSRSADVRTAGVSIGESGAFGSVELGQVHDDNLRDNAAVFRVTAGLGLPLRKVPETEFCPLVSLGSVSGVDFPSGESVSSREYGAGLGLGRKLRSAPGLDAVAFASGAIVYETEEIKTGRLIVAAAEDHYVTTALGVGFVVQRVFTVAPSMNFVTAHGQTTAWYALRLSFAFGRVRPRPAPVPGDGSLATVWVNPRAMLYYCAGSPRYANTEGGSFMTEREALAAGYTPDRGKRC